MILNEWAKIGIKYNAVFHMYSSAQLYIFHHIKLKSTQISLSYLNNTMINFLCVAVVDASFLISSEKNWNKKLLVRFVCTSIGTRCCWTWSLFNKMASIDTDIFHHSISIEFSYNTLLLNYLNNHGEIYILIRPSALKCLTTFSAIVVGNQDA